MEKRLRIKHLLVDADLDKKGSLVKLAKSLGVNRNCLNMALTGYRSGPASDRILDDLEKYLTAHN
jgi:hypothetical protein